MCRFPAGGCCSERNTICPLSVWDSIVKRLNIQPSPQVSFLPHVSSQVQNKGSFVWWQSVALLGLPLSISMFAFMKSADRLSEEHQSLWGCVQVYVEVDSKDESPRSYFTCLSKTTGVCICVSLFLKCWSEFVQHVERCRRSMGG